MTLLPDRFNRLISEAELEYTTNPIPHGRLFRFGNAVFTAYNRGSCRWQGSIPDKKLKKTVERAMERACKAAARAEEKARPPGIFDQLL